MNMNYIFGVEGRWDERAGKKIKRELGFLDKAMRVPAQEFAKSMERGLSTVAYRAARASALLDRHLLGPLKKLGDDAIKTSTTVNKSMGEIQTLLQGQLAETTERAKVYKEELIDLSTTVVKSVKDMTEGLYEYISAFGELDNTVEGYTIAAKVATAGLSSTQQAVDLLSSVSLAYGDTSTKTQQKIADLAFETVRLAKTHIPELADNISKVAPVAAIMNVSLEELFGTTATLIGITGNTTEVFTQMRRVILSMQKPNQTMVSLLEALGYAGSTAGKQLISDKGLVGSIKALNTIASEMDVSIEKAVGRVQGIMPVLAFQSQAVQERFEDMYEAMEMPGGAAERALDKYLNGIASSTNQLESLKIEFENLKMELGERLLPYLVEFFELMNKLLGSLLQKSSFPALENLMKHITDLVERVSQMEEKWISFFVKIATYGVIASPLLGFLSTLLFAFEALVALARLLVMIPITGLVSSLNKASSAGLTFKVVLQNIILNLNKILLASAGFLVVGSAIALIITAINKTRQGVEEYTASITESGREAAIQSDKIIEAAQEQTNAYHSAMTAAEDAEEQIRLSVLRKYELETEAIQLLRQVKDMEAAVDKARMEKLYAETVSFAEKRHAALGSLLRKLLPDWSTLDWAKEALGEWELPDIETLDKDMEELQKKIDEVRIRINNLNKEKIDIEVNVIPELEEESVQDKIDKILASADITLKNLGLFTPEGFLDVSELNKLNNILNETTNEFEGMSGEFAYQISELETYIEDLRLAWIKMDDVYNKEVLQGGFAELEEPLRNLLENLRLQYEQAKKVKEELEEIYSVLGEMAKGSEFIANQYYEATKESNKYKNALTDIETLNESIASGTYPRDVIARLKKVRGEAWKIVDAYEAQQREIEWINLLPDAIRNIPGAKDIWINIKGDIFSKESMWKMLESVTNVLNDPSNLFNIDVSALNKLKAYLEKELAVDPEPLSDIEQGLKDIADESINVGMALSVLNGDLSKYSDQQKVYLQGIVYDFKEAEVEAARYSKILSKIPASLYGTKLGKIMEDVIDKQIEEKELVDALAMANLEKDMAKAFRDEERLSIADEVIAKIEEEIALLEKEEKAIKNIQSLYTGDVFSVGLDLDTGKLTTELTEYGKVLKNIITGAIDPITGLFTVIGYSLMKVPEVQDLFNSLMIVFDNFAKAFGPAISNILIPLINSFARLGTYLGMLIIPILDQLAPLMNMIAIILDALLIPAFSILSPIIAIVAGIFEALMPIIGIFAKAIIYITSPLQYLGAIMNWASDTLKGAFHNVGLAISAFIAHMFNAEKRREYIRERGGYTDFSKIPTVDERVDQVTKNVDKQIQAIDQTLDMGAGSAGEDISSSISYYTDIASQPTNPFAPPSSDSSGSGASIQQMTQHNYININVGAVAGNFDEFVLLVQQRMYELREVS